MNRYALVVVALVGGCAHSGSPGAQAPRAPQFENLGSYHRAISTRSAEAQRYFDQGLRLIYAFNHDEAQRSFEQAARIDPNCVSCYWGAALVLGPNINMPAMPDRATAALAHLRRAEALKARATPVEQALLEALGKRYAEVPPPMGDTKTQPALDAAYAAAMREVAKRFPEDNDVQVLFAEALMDLRPWNLWTLEGRPQPGTDELVATLERVLGRASDHPGANHYYIHAVEASPHPEKGLAAAQRVAGMMPGAGHLVHMPSHVYMRVGRYEEASEANRKAIAADKEYVEKAKPNGYYSMYVAHNFQFLWASAMMEGRSAEALEAARNLVKSMPLDVIKMMPGIDFLLPSPALALARFGRWELVLKEEAPPAEFKAANALHHYARARAFIGTGKLADADAELKTLDELTLALGPDAPLGASGAGPILAIAHNLVAGLLANARGDHSGALKPLKKAVELGDKLAYAEPPDWYYPPRQALGALLLAAGKAAAADAVYREDLKHNPENGWSLLGLSRSLEQLKRVKDAADADARFKKAFEKADIQPTTSDY